MKTLALGCVLAAFACTPHGDLSGYATHGQLGVVGFEYQSALGGTLDTPVAAGARLVLHVGTGFFGPSVAGIRSSDPAIATLDEPASPSSSIFSTLHAGAPGTATLEAISPRGDVMDLVQIVVQPVDGLSFVSGWLSTPGPTVVVGATQRYWVKLTSAGRALAGNGVTHFTYTGPLVAGAESAAPWDNVPDSEENFALATSAGTGTITAASGAATAQLSVELVDGSALTSAVVSPLTPDSGDARVIVTGLANVTPVYGAHCVWNAPDGLSIAADSGCMLLPAAPQIPDGGGWTGSSAGMCWRLKGAPGEHHPVCTLAPSTLSVPVTVTVP